MNCYLASSAKFPKELLFDDKLSLWNDLTKENIANWFISAIENCILPNRISFLKFSFNSDYYEIPDSYNSDFVAPSLKLICDKFLDLPIGYPEWFYVCFPDVAYWAIFGSGSFIVKNEFKKYPESQTISGDFLSLFTLNKIINRYKEITGQPLECKIYRS